MSEPRAKRRRTDDVNVRVTHVLALKLETSGSNLTQHFVTEFAGAVFRVGAWRKPLDAFYHIITDDASLNQTGSQSPRGWEPWKLFEYWLKARDDAPVVDGEPQTRLTLMNLRRQQYGSVTESIAVGEFVEWAQAANRKLRDDERMVVVVESAAVDCVWFDLMLSRYAAKNSIAAMNGKAPNSLCKLFDVDRPVRDLASFYMGVGRKFELWNNEKSALDALDKDDLPKSVRAFRHDRNPLNDASYVGACASYLITQLRKK